ncbi:hypothetical protein, partial [Streptomyces sp. NPDC095613]|uniref:hypothetical protein n=1 Tax=Streptomyces sp. NPDC095613 TaxID=3155540 RepID=UPI00331688F3
METLCRLSYWGEQRDKAYPMTGGARNHPNRPAQQECPADPHMNAGMPRTEETRRLLQYGAYPQQLFGGVLLSH